MKAKDKKIDDLEKLLNSKSTTATAASASLSDAQWASVTKSAREAKEKEMDVEFAKRLKQAEEAAFARGKAEGVQQGYLDATETYKETKQKCERLEKDAKQKSDDLKKLDGDLEKMRKKYEAKKEELRDEKAHGNLEEVTGLNRQIERLEQGKQQSDAEIAALKKESKKRDDEIAAFQQQMHAYVIEEDAKHSKRLKSEVANEKGFGPFELNVDDEGFPIVGSLKLDEETGEPIPNKDYLPFENDDQYVEVAGEVPRQQPAEIVGQSEDDLEVRQSKDRNGAGTARAGLESNANAPPGRPRNDGAERKNSDKDCKGHAARLLGQVQANQARANVKDGTGPGDRDRQRSDSRGNGRRDRNRDNRGRSRDRYNRNDGRGGY